MSIFHSQKLFVSLLPSLPLKLETVILYRIVYGPFYTRGALDHYYLSLSLSTHAHTHTHARTHARTHTYVIMKSISMLGLFGSVPRLGVYYRLEWNEKKKVGSEC